MDYSCLPYSVQPEDFFDTKLIMIINYNANKKVT